MKTYILFSEEELTDLALGNVIEHPLKSGEIIYFMCAERYEEQRAEEELIVENSL